MSEVLPFIPLRDQIACVERELETRKLTYPVRVLDRKMSQFAAELELQHMTAALDTLRRCAALDEDCQP